MNKKIFALVILVSITLTTLIFMRSNIAGPNINNEEDAKKLNASADYLEQNQMLFGKIKPAFFTTSDGKIGLSYSPLNNYLRDSNIQKDSPQAKAIEETYLSDAENAVKRANNN